MSDEQHGRFQVELVHEDEDEEDLELTETNASSTAQSNRFTVEKRAVESMTDEETPGGNSDTESNQGEAERRGRFEVIRQPQTRVDGVTKTQRQYVKGIFNVKDQLIDNTKKPKKSKSEAPEPLHELDQQMERLPSLPSEPTPQAISTEEHMVDTSVDPHVDPVLSDDVSALKTVVQELAGHMMALSGQINSLRQDPALRHDGIPLDTLTFVTRLVREVTVLKEENAALRQQVEEQRLRNDQLVAQQLSQQTTQATQPHPNNQPSHTTQVSGQHIPSQPSVTIAQPMHAHHAPSQFLPQPVYYVQTPEAEQLAAPTIQTPYPGHLVHIPQNPQSVVHLGLGTGQVITDYRMYPQQVAFPVGSQVLPTSNPPVQMPNTSMVGTTNQ